MGKLDLAMLQQQAHDAANRLHHLSMRYSGAIVELAKGQKVGLLPKDFPGLREARDLIDLMLLTRAEINGLTQLLVEKKVFTTEEFLQQVAEQYDWLAKQKASFLGCKIIDGGLSFSADPEEQ